MKRPSYNPAVSTARRPRVFIVGGGFAGLAAAKALRKAPADVVLFDRRNHHVFQPLLYQVATASLSPADISAAIRTILRDQKNAEVVLAEVKGVDVANRRLILPGGTAEYDYLILAAGATHSYFGHDEWAPIAPGLKTLEDATELRRRILLAFEAAEYEASPEQRRAALTFAIVGGGPTGVELAGAIKEIAGKTLPEDYRNIDTRTTRVILFQGGDRILESFPPQLSARAQRDLEKLGVEVRIDARVTDISREGLRVGEEFFAVHNIFWAAGVKANSVGASLGVELDASGRVKVGPDLTIPGHPEVFVAGDMAAAVSADTGQQVPGVAQGGIQMGRYAGEVIAREVRNALQPRYAVPPADSNRTAPGPAARRATATERKAFVYNDKGILAVIGKNKAVAHIRGFKFGGFFAWAIWGGIHVAALINFRNRVQVLLSWFWGWLLNARDARLITGEARIDIETPLPGGFVRTTDASMTQT